MNGRLINSILHTLWHHVHDIIHSLDRSNFFRMWPLHKISLIFWALCAHMWMRACVWVFVEFYWSFCWIVLCCAVLCHVMSWSLILTSIHMNQSLVWMRSPCIGLHESLFIFMAMQKGNWEKGSERCEGWESCRFQTQTISIIMYGPVGEIPPQWFTRACISVFMWVFWHMQVPLIKFRAPFFFLAWLGFVLGLNNIQRSWAMFS